MRSDADGGRGHGDEVAQPSREDRRQGQRAEELDGHGDADGQAGQGRVEGEVHQAEGEPNASTVSQAVRPWPRTRGRAIAQRMAVANSSRRVTEPPRTDLGHQGGGQRTAELHRDDGGQDEDQRSGRGPRRHHGWRL